LLGILSGLQFAFVLVGAPGLMVGVLVFMLRDPARQEQGSTPENGKALFMTAVRFIAADWRMFGGFLAIVCVMTIVAYRQSFFAAMFERTWGWPSDQFARYNGVMNLVMGPLTVLATGWYIDRLFTQGFKDAPVRILIGGVILLTTTHALAPLMPNGTLAFVLIALNLVGMASVTTAGAAGLMNIAPGEIRSQVTALYFVIISVTGLNLGPPTVGLLSDFVFGAENIRYALAMVPVIYGVPLMFTLRSTLRRYRQRIAQMG